MSSTRLPAGARSSLSPGFGVNSTSSISSETHCTSVWGTPYSCSSMPRSQRIAVVWKVFTPIRLPIRSFGSLIPAPVLTKMKPWRNRRWRNTGIASSG